MTNCICPFCYQNIVQTETSIYNIYLNQSFGVHLECARGFERKNLGYKLFNWLDEPLQKAEMFHLQLESLSGLEQGKAFVEVQLFHLISTNPLLTLSQSTQVKSNKHKDLYAILDLKKQSEEQWIYQPRAILIPLLTARMSVEVYLACAKAVVAQDSYKFQFMVDLAELSKDNVHFSFVRRCVAMAYSRTKCARRCCTA